MEIVRPEGRRWQIAATGVAAAVLLAFAYPAKTLTAPLPDSVEIKEMTWVEVRSALQSGFTTVIVPTGGIPMMLFGAERGANVDGAPIVNGVSVVIKAAEMAVRLRQLDGLDASRVAHSGFALPTAQAREEFLAPG